MATTLTATIARVEAAPGVRLTLDGDVLTVAPVAVAAPVEADTRDAQQRVASLEQFGDAATAELNRVCGRFLAVCEAVRRVGAGESLPTDPRFADTIGPIALDALRTLVA